MDNIQYVEDLDVIKNEAASWLVKLDGDRSPGAEEKAALSDWLARSPQHRESLMQLATLWNNLNVLNELTVPLDAPKTPAMPSLRGIELRYAGAVMGLLLLGVALLLFVGLPGASIDQSNGHYATAIGRQHTQQLADGSQFQLNTNSRLKVHFGEHYRDIILLQGEAHFVVAKNPRKPFRVFAGKGRVQAVGTAFSVYLNQGAVDVTVTEGRVDLAGLKAAESVSALAATPAKSTKALREESATANQEVTQWSAEILGSLVAGQGAILKEGSGSPAMVLSELQIYKKKELDKRLAWRRGLLVFEGETLEQVVAEVTRYTEVMIEIPDREVRQIKVGGQFAVGDTQLMLDALEATFSLQIEWLGDKRVSILAKK